MTKQELLQIKKLYFLLTNPAKWETRFINRIHREYSAEHELTESEKRALHSIMHRYRESETLTTTKKVKGETVTAPLHICDERCAKYETEPKVKVTPLPLFDATKFNGEGSQMTKPTQVKLEL